MATAGNGMRPGEYMESSLVKVWPPTVETGGDGFDPDDLGVSAWEERRPEFYVAVTRRSGTTWRTEILRASPIDDGVIPHEVFERLVGQRDRIIAKQRRDRGVEQAAQRNGRQEHGVRVRGKVRENRLRRVAKRRGLILSKSKRRDPASAPTTACTGCSTRRQATPSASS